MVGSPSTAVAESIPVVPGAIERLPAGVRRRPVLRIAFAAAGMALGAVAWQHRAVPLERLGGALVVTDRAVPADVAVVSMASAPAAALDAAKLYRRGMVRQVWIARWRDERVDRRVEALGVHAPRPHDVARSILLRGGVPAAAITLLDEPVSGLESEMAVIGEALRAQPTLRPIILTAATHTARARLLLREVFAPAAHVRVRPPHAHGFAPDAWWRDRSAVREVALEYAKWLALLANGPVRER